MSDTTVNLQSEATTTLPTLLGIDHVEIFVGNVRHAAHYYSSVWQFEPIAIRGLKEGARDCVSLVLRQGGIVLVLTGSTTSASRVSDYLRLHGEGVATVALAVDNAQSAYQQAVRRGANLAREPETTNDDNGQITCSEVLTPDGFSHLLVDRTKYRGTFMPGFRDLAPVHRSDTCLTAIDHVAVAVDNGKLDAWVNFYETIWGFQFLQEEAVSTDLSGMRTKVVEHLSSGCKIALVEPAKGQRTSQVQEFLTFNNGPGVQHLAVSTPNILRAVRGLRNKGVEFVKIPPAYYDALERRVGSLGKSLDDFRELGLLVDNDEWGSLLQIFARPCQDRPTMFFEVIERRGARGFGAGNIRALFESVEREQQLRGTA